MTDESFGNEFQGDEFEPDWDLPINLSLTANGIIHALFANARQVHTGWESCIDPSLVVFELTTEDASGNVCRLVEQEFETDDGQNWHDWSVELKLGNTYVVGHWQLALEGSYADWDWCGDESAKAFEKACVLLGKRVRRGIGIEDAPMDTPPPSAHRH
ncbi:MAG: hypothetical protein H6926_03245 [Chromatiales bacterium]|nr:hypothetical protein [Gammaproteobacteria bacterium]MCP5352190.1 hypothetical protein [Chromatiales bacterium]